MKWHATKWYSGAVVAALLAMLGGCGASTSHKGDAGAPIPVTVITAQQSLRADVIEATGTVEPSDTVAVKSRVDGQIKAVLFKEGDLVTVGQSLYQLDDAMARAQVAAAVAQRARDAATAVQLEAEYKRNQTLAQKGFASASMLDQARAAAAAAEQAAKADAAQIDVLKTQLGYYTITAPVAGRTGESASKPGAAVKANDTGALVTINRISPVRVRFSIPARSIAAAHVHFVANDATVSAHLHDDKSAPARGRLVFLDNAIDASNGELLAKGEFANDDEHLWPGSLVDVGLELGSIKVVAVPETSVALGDDGATVFIAKGKTVERRRVVVAARGEGYEYIASGIAPGETVVVDGASRLQPGAKIAVQDTQPHLRNVAARAAAGRTP